MNEEQKNLKQNTLPKKGLINGKYFIITLIMSLLVLCGAYTVFAFTTQGSVLPNITVGAVNVGGFSSATLKNKIFSIAELKDSEKVVFVNGNERIAKKYSEIGVSIDQEKSLKNILVAGKYKAVYPTPSYLLGSLKGKYGVALDLIWDSDKTQKINEELVTKKTDPQNPKLSIKDSTLVVEEGVDGSTVDLKNIKNQVENCFQNGCYSTISLKKTNVKPNFEAADVEPFKDQVSKIVFNPFTIKSNSKNIVLTKDNLMSFIDIERTVLEQKIVFSDEQISNYLKDQAGKINSKGKSRIISATDNSVISEGREAVEVDINKSKDALKDALSSDKRTSNLVVSTVAIKEETKQPGYTLNRNSGKYIEVNLADQMLYCINGGNLEKSFRVSTGKWSMPTPQGEYSINNKDPRAYSQEYGLYMPYWMAFIGSQYGIHELPEWPDGTKEGEAHLGTPVSHGCVRLGRGAAQEVYDWTDIGTAVYIHK